MVLGMRVSWPQLPVGLGAESQFSCLRGGTHFPPSSDPSRSLLCMDLEKPPGNSAPSPGCRPDERAQNSGYRERFSP